MAGLLFRMFRVDRTEVRGTMPGEQLQLEIGEFRTELAMLILNGVVLDEEQLLFIAGGQTNTFDDDVDEAPVQGLALNEDNVFQADQCDAFNSDVDEGHNAQTMFMANLSSADLIYDDVGSSYDSDILYEVQDHDNYLDSVGEYHGVDEMQNDVQPNYVVDSDAEYTSDSNIIPYEQYVKDNAVQVVQSNVSSVPNDALMLIINDMHEQAAQFKTNHASVVVHDSKDTLELAEITRKRMLEKVKSPLCVEKKVKIAPPDYSKEKKNRLIENENLIATCLSNELLYSVMNDVDTVSRFSEMHNAYTVEQARCLELEAEISKLKHKIQKVDHKHVTALQEQKERFRAENEKVKQHYKELYDSIKITRAKTIEKTTSQLTENKKLKAQLKGKMQCVTMSGVKPNVLAPCMYAIDVELTYIKNHRSGGRGDSTHVIAMLRDKE
ncbi:hypothetical protein Tco_0613284 [Tanacetum coccineum]